jgi:RNA polymerase sigma-70 factor (ECF subfamily)
MNRDIEKKDEREIILSAKKGDRKAFNILMERYGVMVLNLCIKILSNYDDANDCAQETFIRAYKGLKNFRQESSFSTWIYRIAVNICKNHMSSAYSRHKKDSFSIHNTNDEGKTFVQLKKSGHPVMVDIEKKIVFEESNNFLKRFL